MESEGDTKETRRDRKSEGNDPNSNIVNFTESSKNEWGATYNNNRDEIKRDKERKRERERQSERETRSHSKT
jgi:hypothetical protein